MQVAVGHEPLMMETYRLFPHAFSNRIYLHLTLDKPFDLEKEDPVEVSVNGKIFRALPMLNWGGPVYRETLLLNFERDFPKRQFVNHRLIYVDVTDGLLSGKFNSISINYPSITGGFLHNWPADPVELELLVQGEQVSTRAMPQIK